MFRRRGNESGEPKLQDDGVAVRAGRVDQASKAAPAGARRTSVSFHPDVPHRVTEGAKRVPAETPSRGDGETKRLTVGKDISLNGGEITDCEHLVVEGSVQATLTGGRLLEIARGGVFKGSVVIENANISGVFEGELKVNNRLYIMASGQIRGTIRYGQLEVERGGRIDGNAEYDGAGREADLQPIDVNRNRAARGAPGGLPEPR